MSDTKQSTLQLLESLKNDMKTADYNEVKEKIEKAGNTTLGYIAFSLRFHKFRVENRDK